MNAGETCRECGAVIPAGSPAGRCAKCLLALGLERTLSIADSAAAAPADTTRVTPLVTEKPGDRIGRYKLLQKIGEGGCGIVYMAQQEEPVRRRVALKVIKLGMDTKQVIARFGAEQQALALMDHPNIAKVLDAGATQTGRPYFVMELVRGTRITEYCDANNVSTAERLALFIQVCQAIQHAHQKGIIHRDIKPSNILVTLSDGVPLPKVIDFGIAKATAGPLTDQTVFTAFEQFIGTPAYMSPEQAEMTSLDIDTRSDIYSLGVLLYELLTGKTPFDAKELLAAGLEAIRRTIREVEPPRPSTRLSSMLEGELTAAARQRRTDPPRLIHLVRGDLDWIVMKCLEKDRTRRYETANAVAMDLQRHLNEEPILARPPSTAYQVQKFVRRNKVVGASAAFITTALVLGIVGSTVEAIRARRAERTQSTLRTAAENSQAKEAKERRRAEAAELFARQNLYAAQMSMTQQAWEDNNLPVLRELLTESANYSARGFEWFYWQRLANLELKAFRGHSRVVVAVALSPDGQRLATCDMDEVKLWEVATGRELLTLNGSIDCLAFSPKGERMVTGGLDNMARLWDPSTGKELMIFKGHHWPIASVAFSPDGQRIVTTGRPDPTAKIWEAATGRRLTTLKGHGAGVNSAVFFPDGRRILTGSDDDTARVWDAASGNELLVIPAHIGGINAVTISPNGQRIAGGGLQPAARIWDAATGLELAALNGHTDKITSLAFSSDGQWILTGSFDRTARLWQAANALELTRFKGHELPVLSVGFSPDGLRVVTGSSDKTAKVWDTAAAPELTLLGHSNIVLSVGFSPDSRQLVSVGIDGTARLWDAATGNQLLVLTNHTASVRAAVFLRDGQRLATGDADHLVKIVDAASGEELSRFEADNGITAFSPDGLLAISRSGPANAKVWDTATGKELTALKGKRRIWFAAFSSDGRRVVTGDPQRIIKSSESPDLAARVWDTTTGEELVALTGHSGGIWWAAFSPDDGRIITASVDRTARIWDASTGKQQLILKGHAAPVISAAFSRDGQRVVTGGEDSTARVWDATTGKELLKLKGHRGIIYSVAFSPDGQRIATGSDDFSLKIWEAATPGQVNDWKQQVNEAAEHLPELQREAAERRARLAQERAKVAEQEKAARANDLGAIKDWLLLAPIPFEGTNSEIALNQEQVPQEAQLHPLADERVEAGKVDLAWKATRLPDDLIDFNQLVGAQTDRSVAYAVCYITCETPQTGLVLNVGSDDEAKVYLNGKEIYRASHPRAYVMDEDSAAGVDLNAGLNTLVFKVVNETQRWQGSIRLSDPSDQPVKGIRVTLTPPVEHKPPLP